MPRFPPRSRRGRGSTSSSTMPAYGGIEAFLDMTADLWDRTLALNVTALALLTAAAGRVMNGRAPAASSTSPRLPRAWRCRTTPPMPPARRRSIPSPARRRWRWRRSACCVNSVAPGMMDTEMQRSTEEELARVEGRNDLQAFLDERTRRVPLGRRAEIAEVAAAVIWLALDAPAYITAERLNVSGGLDKD